MVSGGATDLTVSGELVGIGLFSPVLPSFGEPSTAPNALRNQPLTRDCTGEESGVGEREGNDVRLLSSAAGEGVRPNEALELRLSGLTRIVLLFLLTDAVDCCDSVRTRSAAPGVSEAAIFSDLDVRTRTCETARMDPPGRRRAWCCRDSCGYAAWWSWSRLKYCACG